MYHHPPSTRSVDVTIKHNVGAQKIGNTVQRYDVDLSAKLRLTDELVKGYVKIDKWLKRNSLPRLTLPSVCGYIPIVDKLYRTLRQESKLAVPMHDHEIVKD